MANSDRETSCTLEELKKVMTQIMPRPTRPPPRGEKKSVCKGPPVSAMTADGRPPLVTPGFIAMLGSAMTGAKLDPYNEVYPGIYLGDQSLAHDKEEIKSLGITHILNTAQGKKFNQINTTEETYSDIGVHFMGISAPDVMGFNLSQYFQPASDFIKGALDSGGKVFVHCQMGLSRSTTLVLAYLMIEKQMPIKRAMRTLRQERAVMPNDGFLKQLIHLNTELFDTKTFSTAMELERNTDANNSFNNQGNT